MPARKVDSWATLQARFWAKVLKAGPDECWEWKGAKVRKGRAVIRIGGHIGKLYYAARIAWYLTHGEHVPASRVCCHSCDNPSCVNPSHLFIGTQSENMSDMFSKGRARLNPSAGEKNGNHKITAAQAKEIQLLAIEGKVLQRDIAKRFGVCVDTVKRIKRGERWASAT